MRQRRLWGVALRCCVVPVCWMSTAAWAQASGGLSSAEDSGNPAQEPVYSEAAAVRAQQLAIVRGLYLETQVGAGFVVGNAKIENPADFKPALPKDAAEKMSGGGGVTLGLGYDITDSLALWFVGGVVGASGRRSDRVRDLLLLHGGVGFRLSLSFSDRIKLVPELAALYVSAENAVEDAQSGFGIRFGGTFEYYVHVRHFSVGVNVHAIAPLSPRRIYVGIAPMLKYTF